MYVSKSTTTVIRSKLRFQCDAAWPPVFFFSALSHFTGDFVLLVFIVGVGLLEVVRCEHYLIKYAKQAASDKIATAKMTTKLASISLPLKLYMSVH